MPRWCSTLALLLTLTACQDVTEPDVEPAQALAAITNLSFAQISAGGNYSCGRTMIGGKLYCWGQNGYGQLGNASKNNKKRPTPASSTLSFKWVSAGPGHTCAIATDGKAYCWGNNQYGQLGDGSATERWSPVPVGGGLTWSQIEVGGTYASAGFTCGITTSAVLYCWGANYYGQLGLGYVDYNTHAWPTSISGVAFRQLTAGGGHACAVSTSNAAYCWGEADYGQTGTGGIYYRPTAVSGGLAFQQVTAGLWHTCGTTTGSKAYCWGYGSYGGVGDGTTTNRFAPRAVSGGLSFSRVFAGDYHSCAVTTVGTAYCWGRNSTGQLGDGTTAQRLAPVAVKSTLKFAQLGTRGTHTCGVVKTSGVGYCWGANTYGQVGDATVVSPRLVPTKVAGAL